MRIAHFVQRYPPALGGSEAYFTRLGEALAAQGDDVTVFTSNAVDLEAFWSPSGQCLPPGRSVEKGVEVRRYPLWRMPGRRYLLKPLSLIPHRPWQCLTLPCNPISWQMWKDAGREQDRFHVVHATAFPYAWPIACALRLARRLRVPLLLTPFLHLGDPEDPHDRTRQAYMQAALGYLLRAADCVFVQTRLEREALVAKGIAAEKLVLLGMGVQPEECTGGDRDFMRKKWGVSAEEIVIGHLANKSEEKGTVDLLKAAERLWSEGLMFSLVLAGPEMPNFLRFWSHYPAAARVHKLGVLSDQEKRDFFAGLDIFALPSRSDSFGLVLLEAWANGLPNLAYRAGGVAEVIRPEQDGLLVRCGDVHELGEALARLLKDQDLRRRLGQAGKQRVSQDFRWQDKLDLVRRMYHEIHRQRSQKKNPGLQGKPGFG
jgi:glycosyltransferase involved in cell wall biosynthesis